jgi:hypothetical protein
MAALAAEVKIWVARGFFRSLLGIANAMSTFEHTFPIADSQRPHYRIASWRRDKCIN